MRAKAALRIVNDSLLLVAVTMALLLLAVSVRVTGGPFMAAGVAVAVPTLVWACMKPKRLIYLLIGYC